MRAIRNPDANSEYVSGFRVHALGACPGMTGNLWPNDRPAFFAELNQRDHATRVPAGVVTLIELGEKGWTIVRP